MAIVHRSLLFLLPLAMLLGSSVDSLAQEKIPLLVNIRTKAFKKHVGEVLERNDDAILVFDIVQRVNVTIATDQVRSIIEGIDEKKASQHVDFAAYAAWKLTKVLKVGKIQGNVADVANPNIFINLGQAAGVKKGQTVKLLGDAKIIRDPETDEVLGLFRPELATLDIVEVLGNRLSRATLAKGGKPVDIKRGMVVEFDRGSVKVVVVPPGWKSEDPNLKTADEALFLMEQLVEYLVGYPVEVISRDQMDLALTQLSEESGKPKASISAILVAERLEADILITGKILAKGIRGKVTLDITDVKSKLLVDVFSGHINRNPVQPMPKAAAKKNMPIREDGQVISVTRKLGAFTSLDIGAGHLLEITQGESPSVTIEGEGNAVSLLESSVEEGTLYLRWKSGNNTLVSGAQTSTVTIGGKEIIVPAGSSVSVSGNIVRINGVIIDPNQPVKLIKLQEPVVMRLTVTDIRMIALRNSAQVTCKNLATPSLKLSLLGPGDVSLAGMEAEQVSVDVRGSGDVSLAGMAKNQFIKILGSGDVDGSRLKGDSAKVTILGSGDARVAVTRSLMVTIRGSGDVSYSGAPKITKSILGSGSLEQKP